MNSLNFHINKQIQLIQENQNLRNEKINKQNKNELLEIDNLENNINEKKLNLKNDNIELKSLLNDINNIKKELYLIDNNYYKDLLRNEKYENNIKELKENVNNNKILLRNNNIILGKKNKLIDIDILNKQKEHQELNININNKINKLINDINKNKEIRNYEYNNIVNKINKNNELIDYYNRKFNNDYKNRIKIRNSNMSNLVNYFNQKKYMENKNKKEKKIFIEQCDKLKNDRVTLILKNEEIILNKNKKYNELKKKLENNEINKKTYFTEINSLEREYSKIYNNNNNKIKINSNKYNNTLNKLKLIEKKNNLYKENYYSKMKTYNYKDKIRIKELIKENKDYKYELYLNLIEKQNLEDNLIYIRNDYNNDIKIENLKLKNDILNFEKEKRKNEEYIKKENNKINDIINKYDNNIYFLLNIIKKTPLNYNIKKQNIELKERIINTKMNKLKENIRIYSSDININNEILNDLKNSYKQNSNKRNLENNNFIIEELLEINKLKNSLEYVK